MTSKQKMFVFSTLAANMLYTLYAPDSANGTPRAVKEILIKGGAGVADRRTLITPLGVVTEIDAEDLESLMQNDVFKLHMNNGFIVVEDSKKDVEAVVPTMNHRDASAPTVEDDFGDKDDPDETEPVASTGSTKTAGKKSK